MRKRKSREWEGVEGEREDAGTGNEGTRSSLNLRLSSGKKGIRDMRYKKRIGRG